MGVLLYLLMKNLEINLFLLLTSSVCFCISLLWSVVVPCGLLTVQHARNVLYDNSTGTVYGKIICNLGYELPREEQNPYCISTSGKWSKNISCQGKQSFQLSAKKDTFSYIIMKLESQSIFRNPHNKKFLFHTVSAKTSRL